MKGDPFHGRDLRRRSRDRMSSGQHADDDLGGHKESSHVEREATRTPHTSKEPNQNRNGEGFSESEGAMIKNEPEILHEGSEAKRPARPDPPPRNKRRRSSTNEQGNITPLVSSIGVSSHANRPRSSDIVRTQYRRSGISSSSSRQRHQLNDLAPSSTSAERRSPKRATSTLEPIDVVEQPTERREEKLEQKHQNYATLMLEDSSFHTAEEHAVEESEGANTSGSAVAEHGHSSETGRSPSLEFNMQPIAGSGSEGANDSR